MPAFLHALIYLCIVCFSETLLSAAIQFSCREKTESEPSLQAPEGYLS